MEETNRKTRVCFIMPKAYPLFNPEVTSVFGGAEVDLYMIATELAKDASFDVSFIVADYGQPNDETRENVRIIKSLNFEQNPVAGAWRVWKAMKQANADWYMMETASPGVPLCRLFTHLHGRKMLYRTASERESNGTYLKSHPVSGRLFISSLKNINAVIVQNMQDQQSLKQRYGIDSAMIVNGHRIPSEPSSGKDTILWVGRSAAVKGPRRFVELAKKLPNERFVMVCQQATGDQQYDALKTAAGNVDNLEFIERVPFGQVDEYFQKAKVFVNTSDSEGFPNTFIQACKTASAILSFGVNPDRFLDVHQCGQSCDFDFQQMTENLHEMLECKSYIKLGQNGQRYARNTHDIINIINYYKKIFKG